MKYQIGLPEKIEGKQIILDMKNHPTMVGTYSGSEDSFVIANVQCSINDGKPWDHYYEAEWIDDCDIVGYWSFPE